MKNSEKYIPAVLFHNISERDDLMGKWKFFRIVQS